MTTHKRSAAPEADDLAEVAFLDDAERAESAWLFARERDPLAPAPSSKIANDYAVIEDLLGNLPPGVPDESWHEEVLRAASFATSPSRPWWRGTGSRWAMGGAFVTAAVVAVLLLIPRAPGTELEVTIVRGGSTRSDSKEAGVGDHLVVTARPRGAGDLRVFRSDGTLVARCPDGPACRASVHGDYTIEVTLDVPVHYQVILVIGMGNAFHDGTMDAYLDAARLAQARIVTYPRIDVR